MNKALDTAFNIGGRQWIYIKAANIIAEVCGVPEIKDRWQKATEEQLEKRDKIQNAVKSIAYVRYIKDPIDVVKMAIASCES